MPHGWYSFPAPDERPCKTGPLAAGAEAVFSTCVWHSGPPPHFADHIRRIMRQPQLAATDPWIAQFVRTLHDWIGVKSLPLRMRLVRLLDPRYPIYCELTALPEVPSCIKLQPVQGETRAYPEKWWHREVYDRRLPITNGRIRHERLLVDPGGYLLETDTANLLVRRGTTWYTPDWQAGKIRGQFLAGISIRHLVRKTQDTAQRRLLTLKDLHNADELAVTNAVIGRLPAILSE